MFQDPQSALNPRRRVGTIVTQPLEAAGTANREQRAARARELLNEIGLAPEVAMRFPAQLSGGQTPARQHRARAVRRAEDSDRRRDRVRSRCVGAGAAARSADRTAPPARVSRWCSSRTTFRWCAICAIACW